MSKSYQFEYSSRRYPHAGGLTLQKYPGYEVSVSYSEAAWDPRVNDDTMSPGGIYISGWEGITASEIWEEVPLPVRWKKAPGLLKSLNAEAVDHYGCCTVIADTDYDLPYMVYRELDNLPAPRTWSESDDYVSLLCNLCSTCGIPYASITSRGYSQGDSARLFCCATETWLQNTGADRETVVTQLRADLDTVAAWLWGDVYYVSGITDPNGDELEDVHCGDFYGSDHEASGLVDWGEEAIGAHIAWSEREAANRLDAACRDVETLENENAWRKLYEGL